MKKLESNLQKACIKWFNFQYPNLCLFSVPNGGSRNIIEAKRLKDEGVLAGVADLFLMRAKLGYYGLFIEMKIGKGVQSDKQKTFQKMCISEGYEYIICRSLDEFISKINLYLC